MKQFKSFFILTLALCAFFLPHPSNATVTLKTSYTAVDYGQNYHYIQVNAGYHQLTADTLDVIHDSANSTYWYLHDIGARNLNVGQPLEDSIKACIDGVRLAGSNTKLRLGFMVSQLGLGFAYYGDTTALTFTATRGIQCKTFQNFPGAQYKLRTSIAAAGDSTKWFSIVVFKPRK